MSLFPIIQPQFEVVEEERPLYRETAWDYKLDCPIWKNGTPVIVEGLEAVKVWAWNALKTERFRHSIYSWNYGCELEGLIGQAYTEALKRSEAARYVKECLLTNPYITGITNIAADFTGEQLTITCDVQTEYGNFKLEEVS